LGTVPLERALSKLGVASRTESRGWILAGRVSVAGVVVRDPLRPVVPERAGLAVDGVAVVRQARVVVALHKPRGVVTTRRDPQGRTTVHDLLTGLSERVEAVGRLDWATSGLLLLTNDSRLAARLTDPASGVVRSYVVLVRGEVTPQEVARLTGGLRDGDDWLAAEHVELRKASGRESTLVVQLTEGKNREIRRLCAAVGHEVVRLKRIAYGPIALADLAPGQWRVLDAAELAGW
jgi:23S rRNA pseudouridine2605 synthase